MSIQLAKKVLESNGKTESFRQYKDLVSLLAPNFGYIHILTKWIIQTPEQFNELKEAWSIFNDNKQSLKNANFKLEECSSIEEWGDKMRDILKKAEVTKIIKSHFSNKYKFLITDRVKEYFSILVESGVTEHKQVQEMFASKLAAYKSPEMLEQSLENVIERLTSKYNMEWVIKKCERVGAIIINNDKNRLLVETPIHSILRKLGSPNWCITRSKSHFDSYVGKNKRQFILFDFTEKFGSSEHMIGMTLSLTGSWQCGYNYSNFHVSANPVKSWVKPLTNEDIRNRYLSFLNSGMNVKYSELSKYFKFEEIIDLIKVKKSSSWWSFKTNWNKESIKKLYLDGKLELTNSDYNFLSERSFVRDPKKAEVRNFWVNEMKTTLGGVTNPFVNLLQHKDFHNTDLWIKPKTSDFKTELKVITKYLNGKIDKDMFFKSFDFLSKDGKAYLFLMNSLSLFKSSSYVPSNNLESFSKEYVSRSANSVNNYKLCNSIGELFDEYGIKMSGLNSEIQGWFQYILTTGSFNNSSAKNIFGKYLDILKPSEKYTYRTCFEEENSVYTREPNHTPVPKVFKKVKYLAYNPNKYNKEWVEFQYRNGAFTIHNKNIGNDFYLYSDIWTDENAEKLIKHIGKPTFYRMFSGKFHFESTAVRINKVMLKYLYGCNPRSLSVREFLNRIKPFVKDELNLS